VLPEKGEGETANDLSVGRMKSGEGKDCSCSCSRFKKRASGKERISRGGTTGLCIKGEELVGKRGKKNRLSASLLSRK